MSMIGGIGFQFYGQSEPRRDGSYIATKWFCILFPLIPAGSYRIWPGEERSYGLGMLKTSSYEAQSVGLYWPHVGKLYFFYIALFIVLSIVDRINR